MPAAPFVPPPDLLRDLASRIFLDLVSRSVVLNESAAQIKSNPENLARISFKLAEAFQRVELERKPASSTRNEEFDMKSAELPEWKTAGSG